MYHFIAFIIFINSYLPPFQYRVYFSHTLSLVDPYFLFSLAWLSSAIVVTSLVMANERRHIYICLCDMHTSPPLAEPLHTLGTPNCPVHTLVFRCLVELMCAGVTSSGCFMFYDRTQRRTGQQLKPAQEARLACLSVLVCACVWVWVCTFDK